MPDTPDNAARPVTLPSAKSTPPAAQRITPWLQGAWLTWLVYRLLCLPTLVHLVNVNHPDILGGMVWQGLWLLPAFILTPWMWRARSPYALLLGSMLTLIYLGASGVVLFIRVYGSGMAELMIYIVDFVLLLLINTCLFILLKRLPSMNKVVKKPRPPRY
ncbi:hypothetical protein [Psychrobacter aestuarii]|uniref:DUF2069 domain-containing protein n=1 Tax=Psychrobacter aestuarii TaxID=556327 RepID=A0ABP3FIH5_9GAMM|nr:hypothetical protein [Psychrobacter aestuarii]